MKRKSMNAPGTLSLRDLKSLFVDIHESYENKAYGVEKIDGIFMSFDYDSDGVLYFQTANSPPCSSGWEYMNWVRKPSQFAAAIAELGDQLLLSITFQKWIKVKQALEWPEPKPFNFELFLPQFATIDHNTLQLKMVKTWYPMNISKPTIYLHEMDKARPVYDWDEHGPLPIAAREPTVMTAYFDAERGAKAFSFMVDNEEALSNPFNKGYKSVRVEFRNLVRDYFNSITTFKPEYEGVVFDWNGRLIKFQNPAWTDYEKNSILFNEERV